MSHWFDRMAVDFVGQGKGMSRRRVLKGAGLVTVAASVPTSTVAAQAAAALEGRSAASPGCNSCLNNEINGHNEFMRRCDKTGNLWAPTKSGKKKKARPVNAAKRLACAMQARSGLAQGLNECRIGNCKGEPLRPLETDPNSPFANTPASGCAPGTTTCPDKSCCFGGDLCCVCASTGGFICCVAVVGCTCCG